MTLKKTFDLWCTDYGAIRAVDNRRIAVSVRLVNRKELVFDYCMVAYVDGAALMGMTNAQYDEWLSDEDRDVGAVYDRCTLDNADFSAAIACLTDKLNRKISEEAETDWLDLLARSMREEIIWNENECAALCHMAGLSDEWEAAGGENFEQVVRKAADILGVDIY